MELLLTRAGSRKGLRETGRWGGGSSKGETGLMGARPGEARLGDTARLRKGLFDARLSVNPFEGGCSKEKNRENQAVSDQGPRLLCHVNGDLLFHILIAVVIGMHGGPQRRAKALSFVRSEPWSKQGTAMQGVQHGNQGKWEVGKKVVVMEHSPLPSGWSDAMPGSM